ncbi:recombinase family protein [Paenibacillus albiflavus]|uniref:Recombinase family protein n=1 Tax=Paenibacillus albiflavus TaxID=2545760 RepID=A0A4V2WMV3_9BACL|nr:recombinase family protein [Paenibacillus albiflavus]TCZ73042.1 recombinase family protein [Paenibacillus albiflavus]
MHLDAKRLIELGVEAIINYLRRSRADEEYEKKTGEDTLKNQADLMDRVLSGYGIPYDQVSEIGSGDKISTRPVFQKVIEDLRSRKYQAIAVKEISRMGRGSYTDMGIIYDLIIDLNIFIITPYRVYDPSNPADLRQIRFELFMSREEFETTRERLMGGRITAALAGKWVSGAAPYCFIYDSSTGFLDLHEKESADMKQIYLYYVYGVPDFKNQGELRDVSYRALATFLKRHTNILTPEGSNEWHPMMLRRLITHERNIGIHRFQPKGQDPIIIYSPKVVDEDLFSKAMEKDQASRHKPRTKLDFSPCELAGLVICSTCGRRMIRQFSVQHYQRTDGSESIYEKEFLWCKEPGCTFLKYRSVESQLLKVLEVLETLDADKLRTYIENSANNDDKEILERNRIEMMDSLVTRRSNLKKRMDFIYEKYEDRTYDDETFQSRKSAIEKELNEVDELEKLYTGVKVDKKREINIQQVQKNISTVLKAYHSSDNKTSKNNILRAVFDHAIVEVIEKGKGRREAKFILKPKLRADILGGKSLV